MSNTHNIPLGTLVEILAPEECIGARAFVVYQAFDCDGVTPLYWLGLDRKDVVKHHPKLLNSGWDGGFRETALKPVQ